MSALEGLEDKAENVCGQYDRVVGRVARHAEDGQTRLVRFPDLRVPQGNAFDCERLIPTKLISKEDDNNDVEEDEREGRSGRTERRRMRRAAGFQRDLGVWRPRFRRLFNLGERKIHPSSNHTDAFAHPQNISHLTLLTTPIEAVDVTWPTIVRLLARPVANWSTENRTKQNSGAFVAVDVADSCDSAATPPLTSFEWSKKLSSSPRSMAYLRAQAISDVAFRTKRQLLMQNVRGNGAVMGTRSVQDVWAENVDNAAGNKTLASISP